MQNLGRSHSALPTLELKSRYEIMLENYCKTIVIEANTMVDMAKTQIAPAIESYAADVAKAAAAKSLQSCPTLCNSIDSSPPGSPVAGILQARTLEWVAISFSRGYS